MEFLEIKHYVKSSLDNYPAFVILMSDGKEYISNGCEFRENTSDNIEKLINKYGCKNEIDALMASDPIDMSAVTNASCMFRNSPLAGFDGGTGDTIWQKTTTNAQISKTTLDELVDPAHEPIQYKYPFVVFCAIVIGLLWLVEIVVVP